MDIRSCGIRKRYALLDRDGTLIVEKNYLSSAGELELLPRAVEGLQSLRDAGFGLVIITNQSGLSRGILTPATLAEIHAALERQLLAQGVGIDGIYCCPHLPEDECDCRKPKTTLARQAAAELGFDLRESFVIGDKPCDIELGRACGARTVLVRTGYGASYEASGLTADFIVDDLLEAADCIRRVG